MDRIFVACIKRWPITSLHPFGTLVEQLGKMGELKVETDALLRDNNFASDEFSDAVTRSVGLDEWSIEKEDEAAIAARRDFRSERTFTIDPNGANELDDAIHVKTEADGKIEIGIHIADVAHFIKANSLVDREAKKRGTAVYLSKFFFLWKLFSLQSFVGDGITSSAIHYSVHCVLSFEQHADSRLLAVNRSCAMLPPKIASEICSLTPGEDRLTVSVVFKVNAQTGTVSEEDTWIGKSIIKSGGKLTYSQVDAVLSGHLDTKLVGAEVKDIQILNVSLFRRLINPH
jgi:protein SSD1